MKVINIADVSKEGQEWLADEGLTAVHKNGRTYIAQSIMPGSRYGNPFIVGKDGTRDEVMRKYREHLWHEINSLQLDQEWWDDLTEATALVCCCKPKACHGDVLLAAANWFKGMSQYEQGRYVKPDDMPA